MRMLQMCKHKAHLLSNGVVPANDNEDLATATSPWQSSGLSPATQYVNIATLTDTYPAGTNVSISGRHGFKRLPAPLANILAAIIQADQSIADRTDSITSKRIEDVSVSYATNSQTTLERALTPYKAPSYPPGPFA